MLATGNGFKFAGIHLQCTDVFILTLFRCANAHSRTLTPVLFEDQFTTQVIKRQLPFDIHRRGDVAVAQRQGFCAVTDFCLWLSVRGQQRPQRIIEFRTAGSAHAQAVLAPGFNHQRLLIKMPEDTVLFGD
ncbi:hypothetical protein SRABI106_04380 [Rahnella aquatilis]|nr:hypothetical protein SRABI106_04380 [Rahnella aquatilis]